MAFQVPFRQLAADLLRANASGGWRHAGSLIDRNFAEVERGIKIALETNEFASVTPGGNLDTTSATLASWSGTAALVVPSWATTAIVTTGALGIYAVTATANASMCCRIGSTNGREVSASYNTTERDSVTWSDEIAVTAGETTTIEVYCRRSSGGGTIRADTFSDFTFHVVFKP